jgi:AraC-like DNA-binding protein/anti-sigma regulatory factor (Ser/Thr protein kinase)
LQEAVTFMVRQTDSLLQFARTGQERPPSRTALSQIIESAICAVKKHLDVRSMSIATRTRTAIEVVVDAPSLERAVYNLILNACQAAMDSDHKPSVNIYLSEERGRIFVKIVDNGPGIPDCIRETLFDPFVTKNKHNGTGLGLALASDTAKAHGGSIYVEESVRGRTVFTLTFPGERPGDLQSANTRSDLETARFMLADPSGREQSYYGSFSPHLHHGDAEILKVQHWLQKNSCRNVDLTKMAKTAGLAVRTLIRRFKKATSLKPTEYCQRLRIGKAREMLECTKQSVEKISWAVGYEDPASFSRIFYKIVGLSPSEYRRRFTVKSANRKVERV